MRIDKIKVRPKKEIVAAPCTAEFAAMLACWATSNDLTNAGACAESGQVLQDCMKQKVRTPWESNGRLCSLLSSLLPTLVQGARKAPARSTINYHLARFSKHS